MKNSYLFQFDTEQKNNACFKNPGINFVQNEFGETSKLNHASNLRYDIYMSGCCYLNKSTVINSPHNIFEILEEIENFGFKATLAKIAGGIHAIILIDKQEHSLQAAVDPLGCMPIFYKKSNKYFLISNDSFRIASGETLSPSSIFEYLKYGYLPFSPSLYESINRIRPGEIIEFNLLTGALTTSSITRRGYIPLNERINNIEEAASQLADKFDRFFSRLPSAKYLAGLSGGYDSRLIAAYIKDHDVSFVNFGNPKSNEVRFAQFFAKKIDKELISYEIPKNAVSLYAEIFSKLMRPMESLESAHVLTLSEFAQTTKPSYYVDGFIGDTVVGSSYYYKFGSRNEIFDNIKIKNKNASPIQSNEIYINHIYNNKRSITDEKLKGIITEDSQKITISRAKNIVDECISRSFSHEDVLEMIGHVTRGIPLIAAGPISISSYTQTICPFIDTEIFTSCMNTDKSLRAGDRLYNALWRKRFPEYANIPKNDTRGCATDPDYIYRLKHLIHATSRRFYPAIKKLSAGLANFEDNYSSVTDYVTNSNNKNWLLAIAEQKKYCLPTEIRSALIPALIHPTQNPYLSLRVATLINYLSEQ